VQGGKVARVTSRYAAVKEVKEVDEVEEVTKRWDSGDRIDIRGFGGFVLRVYKTYMGRNLKTGKEIGVKPKRSPYFKVGIELKEKLNGSSS
jgi:nucleoid DNA-binding protein